MRAIDADALIPKLKFILEAENQIYRRESWGFTAKCINAVEDAPTIEERKAGKWKMTLEEDLLGFNTLCFRCSECNGLEYSATPFCRMCGAKMEEGDRS